MNKLFRFTASVALLVILGSPLPVRAQTTHTVTVGDNFFSPSSLTIAQGDTVRWVNAAGGMQHNVTSNTGAWAPSTTAASFTFEVTFNQVGTFPYVCTLHPNMSGAITVQATPPPDETFFINEGLNDVWSTPGKNGQGILFAVFPVVEVMFSAWFTYDSEQPPASNTAELGAPDQRWLTMQGSIAGSTDTANLQIYYSTGGIFDTASPAPGNAIPIGTMTIEFHDCASATATYSIPDLGMNNITIPLVRNVADNIALCEQINQAMQP
jgi:plastocyanin